MYDEGNYPSGRTGWTGEVWGSSSQTSNTATVYVICAPATTTTP
ncbi:MAG TPA: hypothetical protein VGY97_00720 [Solirubrobacteraceae bacterium]|nr:hypothetical protein [Solirubrobacteraceae bacterium]